MGLARMLVASAALAAAACSDAGAGVSGDAGAAACGSCHTTEYAAWSGSRLAASGTSPVFAALAARVGAAWGDDAQARCKTCHQPGFGGDHGIGCVACHAATGNLATRDGLLTVDLSEPLDGPFADPVATPAHGSRASGFLESPDLCGTCHEVTGPDLFHETTLREYEAAFAPDGGAAPACVTCHMPAVAPGPIALGESTSRTRADHAFVGLDPPWGARSDVAATAAADTLALLRSALRLSVIATPATPAASAGWDVTLVNLAGHAVPTGIAFVRDVWVDADFTGADGATSSLLRVIGLGSQPTRAGEPVALITEADTVVDHGLAPGATLTVKVLAPSSLAHASARFTLRAVAVRPGVLAALGLDAAAGEVPTHDVAIVTVP